MYDFAIPPIIHGLKSLAAVLKKAEAHCEARKIKPDVKFIFVSGYAEDAFAKNLPADAKFGFLPKPFSLKQLVEKVKEAMEG